MSQRDGQPVAGQGGAIDYTPVERVVLTAEQAVAYLALPSRKALQHLVDARRLVPLTYAKKHRFHRDELDRFLAEQLAQERQRRGVPH